MYIVKFQMDFRLFELEVNKQFDAQWILKRDITNHNMPISQVMLLVVCFVLQLVQCKKYLIETESGKMQLVVVSDQKDDRQPEEHIATETGNNYVDSSIEEPSKSYKYEKKNVDDISPGEDHNTC